MIHVNAIIIIVQFVHIMCTYYIHTHKDHTHTHTHTHTSHIDHCDHGDHKLEHELEAII